MKYTIKRLPQVQDEHLQDIADPLIRQCYARRGVTASQQTLSLGQLLPPDNLKNIDKAAAYLADAVMQDLSVLIVGDFDADGATSTAICMLALRAMGAKRVDFLIPNRQTMGYGLTPELVATVPADVDWLLTVDNGITSFAGVQQAHARGMRVMITDHHLAADTLPAADIIVNPNQPDCAFPSKAIAGCGVAFYVMIALRQVLQSRGWFEASQVSVPNLATLLDLVALGTVADVVPLDINNRILVQAGLHRIRQGRCRLGMTALMDVTKKKPWRLSATDIGFAIAPRLNAAGRLDDMRLGVQLLITEDPVEAKTIAQALDELNKRRKVLESTMVADAVAALDQLKLTSSAEVKALAVYQADWHQGVIGIVASRLKERTYRPVIAFSQAEPGLLKGSARSIDGVHIRDMLTAVDRQYPGLIVNYGGHAMAAGLTIHAAAFADFQAAWQQVAATEIPCDRLQGELWSDGPLATAQLDLRTALAIQASGPWGQKFAEPIFDNEFWCLDIQVMAQAHLRFELMTLDRTRRLSAVLFRADIDAWLAQPVQRVHLVYRLNINDYRQESLQLLVLQAESCFNEAVSKQKVG
jgi:single-stranded-DNA-specific exonuclease